jgi:hypothetical protein
MHIIIIIAITTYDYNHHYQYDLYDSHNRHYDVWLSSQLRCMIIITNTKWSSSPPPLRCMTDFHHRHYVWHYRCALRMTHVRNSSKIWAANPLETTTWQHPVLKNPQCVFFPWRTNRVSQPYKTWIYLFYFHRRHLDSKSKTGGKILTMFLLNAHRCWLVAFEHCFCCSKRQSISCWVGTVWKYTRPAF